MVSAKRLMLLNANGAKLNVKNVEQEKLQCNNSIKSTMHASF